MHVHKRRKRQWQGRLIDKLQTMREVKDRITTDPAVHVLASCVSNAFETFTENCIRSMKYAAEPALFLLNLIFCDPFWILSYHKRRLRVGAVLQDVTHFHFRFIALVWVGNFLIAFRGSYWVLALSFVRSKRQFGLYRGKNWFWKYENQ